MKDKLQVVSVRLVNEPPLYSDKKLRSPDDVVELMAKKMAQYDRETLCILNLKTNGEAINMSLVSMGGLDAAVVTPREIFKCSILSNANKIIALHNHPSGEVEPSSADIEVTDRLAVCGELVGIELVDHIIVGGSTAKTFSMAMNNMIRTPDISTLGKTTKKRKTPAKRSR